MITASYSTPHRIPRAGFDRPCYTDSMQKIYKMASGEPSLYPEDRTEARLYRSSVYAGELCAACGTARKCTRYAQCCVCCVRSGAAMAGNHGLKSTGKCTGCARLSPRQQAIKDGAKTYTTGAPCGRCGTAAPRRTDSRACTSCASSGGRGTAESELMRGAPDLVMSRARAMELGLNVYRTGRECRHGHAGYRYVQSRGCIPCLRERAAP